MNKTFKSILIALFCVSLFVVVTLGVVSYARFLINYQLLSENKRLEKQVTELKNKNEALTDMVKVSLILAKESIDDYENLMENSVPGYKELLTMIKENEINVGEGGDNQDAKTIERTKNGEG